MYLNLNPILKGKKADISLKTLLGIRQGSQGTIEIISEKTPQPSTTKHLLFSFALDSNILAMLTHGKL